jgi:hypothetical protein
MLLPSFVAYRSLVEVLAGLSPPQYATLLPRHHPVPAMATILGVAETTEAGSCDPASNSCQPLPD